MKIEIKKQIKDKKAKIQINVEIEDRSADEFITYIKKFDENEIIISYENELRTINISDILYFYSDKKYNYCRTKDANFKIKSKLYELEKSNKDFLRISKSCVINIKNVKCFDFNETGKIIVRFNDESEKTVSRRKVRDVMNYLEERRI